MLRRAITTANLALDAADRHWIPVRRHWRLNERHYGDLQGKDKKQTMEQFGEEQFMLWRRSYDMPPPPIDADNQYSQAGDPRYAGLGSDMPETECLKDVVDRMLPVLGERHPARPARRQGGARRGTRQLAARPGEAPRRASATTTSPGSTSRPACPLVYELDDEFQPVTRGGRYLDPEAAAAAAAAVANQGR